MGAGRPWAGLPGIGSTWGDVTRGVAKASARLPSQTPARPKHRVPGRGRGRSGSGRGRGAVRGRRAGRGNRGSPREGSAQPEAGLLQKTTCSFLGCLRLLKHTYSHTPGTATPTYGCTEHAGLGRWGCCQPQRPRLRRSVLQPPLVTDSTPFTRRHLTPSDLDTPTASCSPGDTDPLAFSPPPSSLVCSSPTSCSGGKSALHVTLAHDEAH